VGVCGTQTELEDFVGDAGREWGTHCSFESMFTLNFAKSFACLFVLLVLEIQTQCVLD